MDDKKPNKLKEKMAFMTKEEGKNVGVFVEVSFSRGDERTEFETEFDKIVDQFKK